MEATTFWLIILIITIVSTPFYYAYKTIERKYLIPKQRKESLEFLAHNVARHNIQSDHKKEISQKHNSNNALSISGVLADFGFTHPRKLPEKISLIDILQKEHPANNDIKTSLGWNSSNIFHKGPYYDELTNEEWQFLQNAYHQYLSYYKRKYLHTSIHSHSIKEFEKKIEQELKEQQHNFNESTGEYYG